MQEGATIMEKLLEEVSFNASDIGPTTVIIDKKFVETYMKRIGELDIDLFIHLMNEMHFHEGISHFSNIDSPTLVIGGDKDKLVPNYLQKIYSLNLRDSEFYLVKEGSHVPQVDFPDSINERIFNFIKKRCLNQGF